MSVCMHTADVTCRYCLNRATTGPAVAISTFTLKANSGGPELSDEEFRELVGIAIGRASMCWSETPKGIFDSTAASKLVAEICKAR